MASRRAGGVGRLLALLVVLALPAVPVAQEEMTAPEIPPPPAETIDPFQVEVTRAQLLARLRRFDEAATLYRELLVQRPDDRELREGYAETLVEAGRLSEAARVIDRFLRDAPGSVPLRRLRARVDMEQGEAGAAAGRLLDLMADVPTDTSIAADLAAAELRRGAWRRARDLYGQILARDPENEDVRNAWRDLLWTYAPRFELAYGALFQEGASGQFGEIAWQAWPTERWWVRVGTRVGVYHQDDTSLQSAFTQDVETVLGSVGVRLSERVTLRGGLEESIRGTSAITTVRLTGAYDDGRATAAVLDLAYHELLTNPVSAVAFGGTTDRVSLELLQRLGPRLSIGGRYDFRHYRASGEVLGNDWDLYTRLDVELLRGRIQITGSPLLYFQKYSPIAGSPLQEQIPFTPQQQLGGLGLSVGADLVRGLYAQAGAVGRYDWYRNLTSYEVAGELRWRFHSRLELRVLYTFATEGALVSGPQQNVSASLFVLH
jgi:hypothetical protein